MALIDDALAPYAVIASPIRAIGYIVPDAVFEELHSDDLAITDHPVETGAAISDHAFKLPSRIEMRCGCSNSTAGTEGHTQAMYQSLLRLQAMREPFDVYTGKRVYSSMLLGGVRIETSAASEHALLVVAGLREIIITSTQRTGAGASNQAYPQKTAPTNESGTVQPIPVGQNLDFVTPDPSLGIGPSGADASVGELNFGDGIPTPGGAATGATPTAPSSIPYGPGNALGFFGSFGPNAFDKARNSPF